MPSFHRLTVLAAACLIALPQVALADDGANLRHAHALLKSTPLVDGHNDLPILIAENEKAPGGAPMPVGLEDVSTYPALFAELIKRGWTDADPQKLAGLNLIRTLRDAETVAARLQKTRKPSTATIEQLDRKKS